MARRAVDAIFAFRIARPVGGGPAPYVGAIARPFVRIAGAIGALRQRRATAVLEIVDALAAHEIVADAAEIDPDMAVLVPEPRLELQMLLPVIDAPVLFEVGGPALVPRLLSDGGRRRTPCEEALEDDGRG